MSAKGEDKGVIGTSVDFGGRSFNLELCVPGWRRSQDGFSAFYLTVPTQKSKGKPKPTSPSNSNSNANSIQDEDSGNEASMDTEREYDDDDELSNHNSNSSTTNDTDADAEFVARYKVSFGQNDNTLTRMSSIRNDFDLGVGFPNFTELSRLIESMDENELVFKIEVEIFESQSIIQQTSRYDETQSAPNIAARLIAKMYEEKLNCDAVISSHYMNSHNVQKIKHFKVHKCILTAASPVFQAQFERECDIKYCDEPMEFGYCSGND